MRGSAVTGRGHSGAKKKKDEKKKKDSVNSKRGTRGEKTGGEHADSTKDENKRKGGARRSWEKRRGG